MFQLLTVLLAVCLVLEFAANEAYAAPNCDLKAIFRTPRDFDHFEILERSNFDSGTDNCQDVKENKEKVDPKSFANAQIVLRIGADKDTKGKQSIDPCIPISTLLSAQEKLALNMPSCLPHHHHPLLYQNSYVPQIPYAFPSCLYYSNLQPICQHLVPLIKELISKAKGSNDENRATGSQIEQNGFNNIDINDEIEGTAKTSYDTDKEYLENVKNDPGAEIEQGNTNSHSNTVKPVKILRSAEKVKHIKFKRVKEVNQKKNGNQEKSDSRCEPLAGEKTNVANESIEPSLVTGENSSEESAPLCSIELKGSKDIEGQDKNITQDCLSFHLLKIPTKPKERYQNCSPSNENDLVRLLNDALIPITCSNCDENIKNAVTYPIIHRDYDDKDNKMDLGVEDCGCSGCLGDCVSCCNGKKQQFLADLDDLYIINGAPVAQSNIPRTIVPNHVNHGMDGKGSFQLIPVVAETDIPKYPAYISKSIVVSDPYSHNFMKCTCKECQCHKKAVIYEKPAFAHTEHNYPQKEIRFVQSYLTEQYDEPVQIVRQVVEEPESPREILVPVRILSNEETSGRCSSCTPYERELNQ